ncbi:MAG: helix-turn-helix domain-containing protein [Clostridia bacterium]
MNRIKSLREDLKLSQEELANKLNLSKGIISLYEQEKRKPSLEILIQLSEIFNVSIDYILGRTNIPNTIDEPIAIAAHAKDKIDISDFSEDAKKRISNFIEFTKATDKKK